jgi:hypothetical protein
LRYIFHNSQFSFGSTDDERFSHLAMYFSPSFQKTQ